MDRWKCEKCGIEWPEMDPSRAYYQRVEAQEKHKGESCRPAPLTVGLLTKGQANDLKRLLYG